MVEVFDFLQIYIYIDNFNYHKLQKKKLIQQDIDVPGTFINISKVFQRHGCNTRNEKKKKLEIGEETEVYQMDPGHISRANHFQDLIIGW